MKKIKIADLRAPITVQEKTTTTNIRGGKDTAWSELFKSWAQFKPTSSTQNGGMTWSPGDQEARPVSHKVYVRYDVRYIINQRIVYENDYYVINNMSRIENGNHRYLELAVMWEGTLR